MLFNSFVFILLYLPAVWLGFRLLGARDPVYQRLGLVLASLFFYGYWYVPFLALLLGSIGFNYAAGQMLLGERLAGKAAARRGVLIGAVGTNLALLGYFKYANFFLDNLNGVLGTAWRIPDLILPLGISFFTFTQITYLVDAYWGLTADRDFVSYALFVTFFPHLIAGPILHHREMLPQFRNLAATRRDAQYVALGLFFFSIGLFKKVIVADTLSALANPAFEGAGQAPIGFLDAWTGTLAYTLQLYYDFSGYSDMAVGLGLLFGIRLPFNFDSPYKAASIIDFWRRWHISLSRFLREYVYVPLGGNRRGEPRRYVNMMLTMLLGGLWHGAGWTFLAWGALHGIYLMLNHGWRALGLGRFGGSTWSRLAAWTLTFLAVVVAWVFFRAPDLPTACHVLAGMLGLHGFVPTQAVPVRQVGVLLVLMAMALVCPNIRQIMAREELVIAAFRQHGEIWSAFPSLPLHWRPTAVWAAASFALFVISLLEMTHVSQFLYFQF